MAHLVQSTNGHCLFATFLADSLRASSIKAYLSAVRSLHIEHGFPDPLLNCLRLQRVVCGIKRVQGAASSTCLPVTDSIMLLIFKPFFGFLRASEFIMSNLNSFSPSCHLMLKEIAFDSLVTPSLLRVNIKVSKTDPFRCGTAIHIGCGHYPLCAIQALATYLAARGDGPGPGPLFRFQSGQPLSRPVLTSWH